MLLTVDDAEAIETRPMRRPVFASDPIGRDALRTALDGVRDIERLASKAAAGRGTPRDLRALGDSITRLVEVRQALEQLVGAPGFEASPLESLMTRWDGCADVASQIIDTIVERPPIAMGDENCIREGVDSALDEWRSLRYGGERFDSPYPDG